MKCPRCKEPETKVIDSRTIEDGFSIRRRRECSACGYRFTTYEKLELDIVVIKKDGRREPYDRNKLLSGIKKALHKRPVSEEVIRNFVRDLELDLIQKGEVEVSSSYIGERVMSALKEWDKVAYIRFASVYRDFKDPLEFIEQVEGLKKEKSEEN